MPPKHEKSSIATVNVVADSLPPALHGIPILPPSTAIKPQAEKIQASRRGKVDTNPDHNRDISDGKTTLRTSPDADEKGESLDMGR